MHDFLEEFTLRKISYFRNQEFLTHIPQFVMLVKIFSYVTRSSAAAQLLRHPLNYFLWGAHWERIHDSTYKQQCTHFIFFFFIQAKIKCKLAFLAKEGIGRCSNFDQFTNQSFWKNASVSDKLVIIIILFLGALIIHLTPTVLLLHF